MSHRSAVTFDLNAVGRHLRSIHPTKTAEHVSAAIGVPAETVRQWLRGVARPGFAATLALVGVYGPELLAAALPNAPAWLTRALVAEKRRAAMEEIRRLGERIGALRDDGDNEGFDPALLGDRVGRGLCGDRELVRAGRGAARGG